MGFKQLRLLLLSLSPVLAVVAVMVWARLAPRPTDLGVRSGRLMPCPDSPNCVCSFDERPEHAIEPFKLLGTPPESLQRIKQVMESQPRTTIVVADAEYVRAEFRSRLFGFVDDVEFYAPGEAAVMHCRSASRIGHSDLGANRKRVEALRQAYMSSED